MMTSHTVDALIVFNKLTLAISAINTAATIMSVHGLKDSAGSLREISEKLQHYLDFDPDLSRCF